MGECSWANPGARVSFFYYFFLRKKEPSCILGTSRQVSFLLHHSHKCSRCVSGGSLFRAIPRCMALAGCHLLGGSCQTGRNWDSSPPPVPHRSWLGRGVWGWLADFLAWWDISQLGAPRGDGRGWERAGGLGCNALNAIEHFWSQRAVSCVTGHQTKWIKSGMLPWSSLV